jgi:adenylate cyclase
MKPDETDIHMKIAYQFRFDNTMILANVISQIIGVMVVFYLARRTGMLHVDDQIHLYAPINFVFVPLAFGIPIVITLIYEGPIRRYLRLRRSKQAVSETLTYRAQQRLLNQPFFFLALNGSVWFCAAVTYSFYYWNLGMGNKILLGAFLLNLQVGLVSTTVAFFVVEFFLQHRLAPYFFPNGGLSAVPKTIHIRIRTRLIAFLTAINLIPLFTLARGFWSITQTIQETGQVLSAVQVLIFSHAIIFSLVGIWLTFLVSSNLTRPLKNITSVLKRVKKGDFNHRVSVTSNDELGYVGDVVNDMNAGLQERAFIKKTFGKYVSREVRDEVLSREIPLDGEIRDVSVLFADLRNFTPFVEKTSPRNLVRILNRYFEEMEAAIRNQKGFVLQFIGDEIEAVFGAPVPLADHATRAAAAAMDMNQGLDEVNMILSRQGHPPLQHGIGIHSGTVVAANIGSPSRLSYAMVGDTVNIASRLQDANKQHGTSVIVSSETHSRLSRPFPLRKLPKTSLKGKTGALNLFGL